MAMIVNRNPDGLLSCSRKCLQTKTDCPNRDCRHWIEYEEDNNCCLISINKHGAMTLREIADRIGVTFARIKQIEVIALGKIRKYIKNENPFF